MQTISLHNLPLFNTFGLQAKSGDVTICRVEEELTEFLVNLSRQDRMNVIIAGELSNTVLGGKLNRPVVLFRDGTLLKIAQTADMTTVKVSGSFTFDSLVEILCKNNIQGMELLSGIPGTVAGAITQNIAAYGQQLAETLRCIRVYDVMNNSIVELYSTSLNFSYRSSVFKQTTSYSPRYVILEAVFDFQSMKDLPPMTYKELSDQHILQRRSNNSLLERRETVLEVRERKGMLTGGENWLKCAGSFFMSPIVDSVTAARIVQRIRGEDFADSFFSWYKPDAHHIRLPAALIMRAAGFLNGDQWGPVGLSPHHILALCSFDSSSSASEIYALGRLIQAQVFRQYNVHLEPEVRFLGNINKIEVDEFVRTQHFKPGKGEPQWAKRLGLPREV